MGLPFTTVARGLTSISATTGLTPKQAGGLYTTQNEFMAAGLTGQSLGSVMFGSGQAGLLKWPISVFQSSLGMSVDTWMKWFYHGTPAQKAKARNALVGPTLLYQMDPKIFGGMEPLQITHMLAKAGSLQALMHETSAWDNILGLTGNVHTMDSRIERRLGDYYLKSPSRDRHMVTEYENWLKHNPRADADARKKEAATLMGRLGPRDNRSVAKYTLGLTPDAKKLVTILGNGNDPSHMNGGSAFARISSEDHNFWGSWG